MGRALAALFSLLTAVLALTHGERTITRGDWSAFTAALAIIPLWYYTGDALLAAILATAIDVIAYYPTFRKSYARPREEMIFAYIVSNAKHLASLLAMTAYSMTTLFYPLTLFIANAALIVMLAWRRAQLTSNIARH